MFFIRYSGISQWYTTTIKKSSEIENSKIIMNFRDESEFLIQDAQRGELYYLQNVDQK